MIFSADRFGQYVVTRQKELNHKGSYETNFGGRSGRGVALHEKQKSRWPGCSWLHSTQ